MEGTKDGLCGLRITETEFYVFVSDKYLCLCAWKEERRKDIILVDSVQSLSRVRFFVTPWTAAHQASLSLTNGWSLFKLMSIELDTDTEFFVYIRANS